MQLSQVFAVIVAALPATMAAGEACSYYDSAKYGTVKGTCGSPSKCIQERGYWVANQCPGGDNNRCCIKRSCTTSGSISWRGDCTTVAECERARGPYHTQAGRCPGPANVQCCF